VTTKLFRLALVYDWGENDNIIQYLKLYPQTPRLTLVYNSCLPLTSSLNSTPGSQLLQIAKGLRYLHSLDIPHGNLKGVSRHHV